MSAPTLPRGRHALGRIPAHQRFTVRPALAIRIARLERLERVLFRSTAAIWLLYFAIWAVQLVVAIGDHI